MPFYRGTTPDGSDMEEVEGMYINPKNPNEWSNMPYPIGASKTFKPCTKHEYIEWKGELKNGVQMNDWICRKCSKHLI